MAEVERLKKILESSKENETELQKRNQRLTSNLALLKQKQSEREKREEQLFQHTKHLCSLVEA